MVNIKTNFGKLKVNKNQKTRLVQEIFTDVAKKYDLMNDLMSFGTHRIWKRKFIEVMNLQNKDNILEVGSGTGDLLKIISEVNSNTSITSTDLNKQMLYFNKNKYKNLKNKIKWKVCNAENLPFKSKTFDKYIIAFCLRNITNINKALVEAERVLKCGGIFYCLEFSSPNNFIVKNLYDYYKANFIPLIGEKIANNKSAYKYLEESITTFSNQEKLINKLKVVGFKKTSYIDLFNGIVSIHIGYKI